MNKKGQEEMVGFALIVIIVSVIGVILLVFALKSGSNEIRANNYEIRQFLDSAMQTSTDCTLRNSINYVRINELISACYGNQGSACINSGNNVCEELDSILENIIDKGLKVGEENVNSGFVLNASFQGNGGSEEVSYIKEGECGGEYTAGEYLIPEGRDGGAIIITLTLCKNTKSE